MTELSLKTYELKTAAASLNAGDAVKLSGTVYTARDAAHKRLAELIKRDEELPFELNEAVIYYAGPTPTKPGGIIGSCGPTTSGRMDIFTPLLLKNGLRGMIGKGPRSKEVTEQMIKSGAVYFCAVGGAGALAARCVVSCKEIAFEDLGCESIKQLELKDFPLFVATDTKGNSLFE